MKTFFQDEYINLKILSRMAKEIKKNELEKAIEELNYINVIQDTVLTRSDFTPSQNQELEFIKKLKNARRKNLQA